MAQRILSIAEPFGYPSAMFFFRQKGPDLPPSQDAPQNLAQLSTGIPAIVEEVVGTDSTIERLGSLGIVPGVEISTINSGDPAIVQLPGCRMAMAKELQRQIIVKPR